MSEVSTLFNPLIWQHFKNWLDDQLTVDWELSDIPLEEIRRDYSDLTLSEAKDQACKDERLAPKMILEEECPIENPLLMRFQEDIEVARKEGVTDRQIIAVLRNVGLDLERPTSAGIAKAKRQIVELRKELEILKAKLEDKPPPPLPPEQQMLIDLNAWIRDRLIQERVAPKEALWLTSFIDTSKSVEWNKRRINGQIESLKFIKEPTLPTEATMETIRIRRGIPTEEEILGEEEIPERYKAIEEVEYPTPEYRLKGVDGPEKFGPYPIDNMGSYWTLASANMNKDFLEEKGYTIVIEMIGTSLSFGV